MGTGRLAGSTDVWRVQVSVLVKKMVRVNWISPVDYHRYPWRP